MLSKQNQLKKMKMMQNSFEISVTSILLKEETDFIEPQLL